MGNRRTWIAGIQACFGVLFVSPAFAQGPSPRLLVCRHVSSAGCAEDGACIFRKLSSSQVITFDLGRRVFRSKEGRGQIRQFWQAPDGTHQMIVASPPASAELVFSKDWLSATHKRGKQGWDNFACSRKY